MKIFTFFLFLVIVANSKADDIREFTIGLDMKDFSTRGYTNLSCQIDGKKLKTWADFSSCTKNENGLHIINFEYDDKFAFNEEFEGTQVAGHPVLIYLGIDNKGFLQLIDVKTDTSAPFYFRKQAYLMWLRVYGRYGSDNWTCTENDRLKEHVNAGRTYINRTCIKNLKNRSITLHSKFFFLNKKSEDTLVSSTNMIIKSNSNL